MVECKQTAIVSNLSSNAIQKPKNMKWRHTLWVEYQFNPITPKNEELQQIRGKYYMKRCKSYVLQLQELNQRNAQHQSKQMKSKTDRGATVSNQRNSGTGTPATEEQTRVKTLENKNYSHTNPHYQDPRLSLKYILNC